MKIDLATVCDYAIIDQYGKLSILGIFSHVWVAKFPAVHPRMHLVLHLKGRRTEIGEHTVPIRARVAGAADGAGGRPVVFDVPLPRPGTYTFEVLVDETMGATIPITAAQSPHPMPPPKATGLH